MSARIHPTALIENGVALGEGTAVWDNVHIRHGARLGEQCIVGEKTYIAYDVVIGHRVKINAFVYICAGVTIEDGVMISAGTIFTNDRFPRAVGPWEIVPTVVRHGASIGANATVVCGVVNAGCETLVGS